MSDDPIDPSFQRDPAREAPPPPGGLPDVPLPSSEIFAAMGQENIFRMCRDFYGLLEKSPIRGMFPEDMAEASKKLAAFLVFRFGGPPLYQRQHGPPRLRGRHMAFKIDESSRQAWLGAFRKTLDGADQKYGFPREHLAGFDKFLEVFSVWMVNSEGTGPGGKP